MKTSITSLCGGSLLLALLLIARPALASADPSPRLDGVQLYARHCANCHAPLHRTHKPDRRASRILSSIKHFAVMRSLNSLSLAEVDAIAEVLADPERTGAAR